MTDDVRRRKRDLRAEVLAGRNALEAETRTEAGLAIAALGHAKWGHLRCVAAYVADALEPPTVPLLDLLRAGGTTVLLPVVDGEDLDWARYDGPTALALGRFGLVEPTGRRRGPSGLADAEAILVPALAVDRHGSRLGRGRGYYDRALAATTATAAGVIYNHELVDDVPTEDHDRAVNLILRPCGITKCDGRT